MRVMASYGFVSARIGQGGYASDSLLTSFSSQHTSVSRLTLFGLDRFLSDDVGGSAPGHSGSNDLRIVLEDGSLALSSSVPLNMFMYGQIGYEYVDGLPEDDPFRVAFASSDATRYSAAIGPDRLWAVIGSRAPSRMVDLSGDVPFGMWLVYGDGSGHRKAAVDFSSTKSVDLQIPGRTGVRTFYATYSTESRPVMSTFLVAQDAVTWIDSTASGVIAGSPEPPRMFSLGSIVEGVRGATSEGGTLSSANRIAVTGSDGRLASGMLPAGGSGGGAEALIAAESNERKAADTALGTRIDGLASRVSRVESAPGDVERLESRVNGLESSMSGLGQEIDGLGRAMSSLGDEMSSIRDGGSSDTVSLASLAGDIAEVRGDGLAEGVSLKSLSSTVAEASSSANDALGYASQALSAANSATASLANVNSAIGAINRSIEGLAESASSIREDVDRIGAYLGDPGDADSSESTAFSRIESLEGFVGGDGGLDNRMTNAEEAVTGLGERVGDLENSVSDIRGDSSTEYLSLTSLETDISGLEDRVGDLEGSISDIRGDSSAEDLSLTSLDADISGLEGRVDGLAADMVSYDTDDDDLFVTLGGSRFKLVQVIIDNVSGFVLQSVVEQEEE